MLDRIESERECGSSGLERVNRRNQMLYRAPQLFKQIFRRLVQQLYNFGDMCLILPGYQLGESQLQRIKRQTKGKRFSPIPQKTLQIHISLRFNQSDRPYFPMRM